MILTYVVALVIFLAVDAAWLMTMAKPLYASEIGELLLEKPSLTHAGAFYLIFVAGLVVFVINPALAAASLNKAIVLGAFFGLVTYATYDMTNLATLKGFTTRVAMIDMAWGTFLSATVCATTYLVVTALRGT